MITFDKTNLRSLALKIPMLVSITRRIYNKQYFNKVKKKIVGKDNLIKYNLTSFLPKVEFDILGDNNIIEIGDNSFINNVKFFIRGNNHKILIGERVKFNIGSSIWFEDEYGYLSIGSGTTFEDVHIAVTEPNSSVRIGSDCLFAYDIDIRTGDSHSIIDVKTNKRINSAKNITFGNHIWVAAHCIILKGCTIPDGCIVATGSVLTKPIGSKQVIIAGNPAKVVKENVSWNRTRLY